MEKLTPLEIKQRLQTLRNYEQITYPKLKNRTIIQKEKIKELKAKVKQLEEENSIIQKLQLELEEMKILLYGKKKRERAKLRVPLVSGYVASSKVPRTNESYRRSPPSPESVTGTIVLPLSSCPACGGSLTQKKEHVCYREDLKEVLELVQNAKTITKRIIESGYCKVCTKRVSAAPIPAQVSEFGPNIASTMVYLSILLGLSYGEIHGHLEAMYGLKISEGEMSNMLKDQSHLLRPAYLGITQRLATQRACHYDETTWKVSGESEGNQCWVKIGITGGDVLYWFGRSRGKGVAEQLRGDYNDQIGISDDYGSYRTLFKIHALCWAHPHRKLRELAESGTLAEDIRLHCEHTFHTFRTLYADVEIFKNTILSGKESRKKERKKLETRFLKLMQPDKRDPKKLKTIRESLTKRWKCYFTCLDYPEIPLDNNKAERSLRTVVLHRKKKFGCRNQERADILSILYSVVFSLLGEHGQENFFAEYQKALDL